MIWIGRHLKISSALTLWTAVCSLSKWELGHSIIMSFLHIIISNGNPLLIFFAAKKEVV